MYPSYFLTCNLDIGSVVDVPDFTHLSLVHRLEPFTLFQLFSSLDLRMLTSLRYVNFRPEHSRSGGVWIIWLQSFVTHSGMAEVPLLEVLSLGRQLAFSSLY